MGNETVKYYTSCDELPLYNFIKVVVTGNYSWLVKEGEAKDPDYLNTLWLLITKEYNESAGDMTSAHAFNLFKDINILNDRMALVQMIVMFLTRYNTVELREMLQSMGFSYDFTDESMATDLKMTIQDCKVLLEEMREYERDYQAIIEVNESSKPTEKEYFRILAQLSKFMGFRIDAKTSTVLEFLEYMSLARVE